MSVEPLETPTPQTPPPPRGLSARTVAFGSLLILLLGVFGGGWAVNYLVNDGKMPDVTSDILGQTPTSDTAVPTPSMVMPVANGTAPPNDDAALAARVNDLEHRLARISLEAQSASGNATRAEGLLVAFAARRALDRGLPLGYLDPQLRLRFGDAQPNAVKTIIDAARDPITIEQLRGELEALVPQLMGEVGGNSESFWTAVRREFGELAILRSANSVPTSGKERLERARRYLTAAQVDKAIAEVEAMPGAKAASEWLIDARRYHEARRALDLVETAAILEPRESTSVSAAAADEGTGPAGADGVAARAARP